MATRNLVS